MSDITTQHSSLGYKVSNFGVQAIRLTTATVLAWIGAMKFTAYEAGAIKGLVESSPLVSWLYPALGVQGCANLIGAIEIATAILLLIGIKFPKAALIGAIGAAITFLITISFLFTAPGWHPDLGFPALTVVPGQFLLKDIVLFAAAIFLAGEALKRMGK